MFAILFFPVVLPLGLAIGICSFFLKGSNIFFIQRRPGKHGLIFKIYKFRTLDEEGNSLSKFHAFLRASGLDELPQLINVLKGDMSFVGPRPLLEEYLDRYTEEQSRRHEVKPGITGWAQVNIGNIQTWNGLFHYDLEYLKMVSFLFDLKIIFMTFRLKTKALSQTEKEPSVDPLWLGTFTS